MNGREYTEWQLQVSRTLSEMNQKLDQFKEWTTKHDVARAALVDKVESLEHSRTWISGWLTGLWAIVGSAVAVWLKKFLS